jgi:hypothetical protein
MFTLDHVVPWGRSFDEYRDMGSNEIQERISATYDQILEETRQNAGEFV